MSKLLKINLIILGIVGLILSGGFYNSSVREVKAQTPTATYGVYVDSITGMLSGYAWSDNIGWIKFGGLSAFPTGSGTASQNAQLVSGKIIGWARACSGTVTGDCSTMDSRIDGWDGWISLGGNVASAPASCIPDSPLTQTLSCPTGQTGSITQTRTSTCPTGASSPTTSAWVTTSDTCVTPITCTPDSPLTQTLSCPTGQTGSITQTRTSTCPTGASSPTTSAWVTTSDTCVTPCTPGPTLTQTIPCPNGMTGVITQTKVSTCPGPTYPADWTTGNSYGCREWYTTETPAGKTNWDTGWLACYSLPTSGGIRAGYKWRIPTQGELMDKWNMTHSLPAGFKNDWYWTNDPGGIAGYYFVVQMFYGQTGGQVNPSLTPNYAYIRCVR